MKRTKLMLGIVALSAALLGTGYAAMTDLLTIEGTVTTANFNVDFGKGELKVGDVVCTENSQHILQDQYDIKEARAIQSEDNDQVEITVGPLQPGIPVTYTTTMQNKSNIDAQLKNIILSNGLADVNEEKRLYEHTKVNLVLTYGDKEVYSKTGTLNDFKETVAPNQPIILQERVDKEEPIKDDTLGVKLTLELDANLPEETFQEVYEESEELKLLMHFDWQQRANQ